MRFESEVVSEEVIPAVRRVLAKRLNEDYGLNQSEIAELLDLTQPAVSQYLNDKRAEDEVVEKLREDPQTGLLLKEAADKAAEEEDYSDEIRSLIRTVRDKGIMKEYFLDAERIL